MMTRSLRRVALLIGAGAAALVAVSGGLAQTPPAPSAGAAPAAPARAPAEPWWVEKTQGGVYRAPMRPLWKLADLKKMHAGQSNWQQQIILDPEQDATYNSAAPGSRFGARIHPDTPTVFVVIAGEVKFDVEGQAARHREARLDHQHHEDDRVFLRGDRSQNALWVEVNPTNYKTLYPASRPQPKPIDRRAGDQGGVRAHAGTL